MVVQRDIVTQTIDAEPVNQQVILGTAANTPVSKLNPPTGLSLSGSGAPISYAKCISGVATAYTSDKTTSTGRPAGVGFVAVDPRRIPYGSHLYIMTADGSYVYGTAIAADTGGFVQNGSGVTVDLYLPSSSQCEAFGVKNVKIYVLD